MIFPLCSVEWGFKMSLKLNHDAFFTVACMSDMVLKRSISRPLKIKVALAFYAEPPALQAYILILVYILLVLPMK